MEIIGTLIALFLIAWFSNALIRITSLLRSIDDRLARLEGENRSPSDRLDLPGVP